MIRQVTFGFLISMMSSCKTLPLLHAKLSDSWRLKTFC